MLKGQLYHFVANSKDSFDEEAVYNRDNLDKMDDLGNMHIYSYMDMKRIRFWQDFLGKDCADRLFWFLVNLWRISSQFRN